MIGDLLGLAAGGAALQLRGWTASLRMTLLIGLLFFIAGIFGAIAAFAALEPELGTAWTAALIGGVFLALGLVAIGVNRMSRRRRLVRQLAMAQTAAAVAPMVLRPELLLLAAAAGALFVFGGKRR
jgi:VIT1/CCC1 family predicted Fe2+/Mn2+ transporter